mgnify:CR=1 FL=1
MVFPATAYARKKQELADERARREAEKRAAKDAERKRVADMMEVRAATAWSSIWLGNGGGRLGLREGNAVPSPC